MKAFPFSIMTVLLAVIIAVALVISKNGNIRTCPASENGINESVSGTVKGVNGEFTDECDSNGNLIKYYCNGNSVSFANVYCGGKCVNGTCPSFLKCQFNENARRIILRFDNIGDLRSVTEINLINAILDRNISVTLAVIPGKFGADPLILDYISRKSNDKRVAIAQEGFYHTFQEFGYLNESDAYNLAKAGRDIIEKTLHVQPVAFIAPNNIYNINTLEALSKLGFKILSAGDNENRFDGNMIIIGGTVVTKRSDSIELVPLNDVLNLCKSSLDLTKVCTIIIHPQDYVNNDGVTLNQTRYEEFSQLLDGLKTLNTTFSTFNQIIQCE